MKRKRKKKGSAGNGSAGNGLGPHHAVSPMGHATRTKNRKDRQQQIDRKRKQNGWQD